MTPKDRLSHFQGYWLEIGHMLRREGYTGYVQDVMRYIQDSLLMGNGVFDTLDMVISTYNLPIEENTGDYWYFQERIAHINQLLQDNAGPFIHNIKESKNG